MPDAKRLIELVETGTFALSITTHEEAYAVDCLGRMALEHRMPILVWSASQGFRDGLLKDEPPLKGTERPQTALHYILGRSQRAVYVMLDLAGHLKDPVVLRLLRDVLRDVQETHAVLVLVDGDERLPTVVRSHVTSLELSLPDEQELLEIARACLQEAHRDHPIRIQISQQAMDAIIRNLRGLTRRQVRHLIRATVAGDRILDDNDVAVVLAGKRRLLGVDGLLTYVETPLTLGEIGGMDNLKRWLDLRKDAFDRKAQAFGIEAPRGILMLGVQGAGKSLCAKAVATAWQQPLLRLDPGRLYDSFVGESERNLRLALRQVEMMSPAVLWIDEIEKAFASAASRSTDGGLSQRMFGTLLTWMQERQAPVFVVATANDISALPPELLRKGRFDEIFFVGLPRVDARRQIFEIHLRRRGRDPVRFDLEGLAAAADGYSGAEIEQAIVAAMHTAFSAGREVTTDHIVDALHGSPPLSVTMAERVADLYAWADGRCVPAD